MHVDKGIRALRRDDVSSQGIDPREIEANAFASELLMPQEYLIQACDTDGLDLEDDAAVERLAREIQS